MTDHRLEVAEIFRRYGEKFLSQWGHTLSAEQRKALRDIGVCRTAALGAHLEQCDACGHQRPPTIRAAIDIAPSATPPPATAG